MKILLLSGMSGAGKTSIAKELCKDEKYNFIFSYTDREMRNKDEWGHTFVDTYDMDYILEKKDIVAKTQIGKDRYCSISSQFDKNKINIYIADVDGINDTIKFFPTADIMSVLIRREDIEVDCIRQNRDVSVPARDDVDFYIDNNNKIEYAAGTINTLVNLDLFNKPSHVVQTIKDKLEYIEDQERKIMSVKHALYKQFWYQYQHIYIALIDYLQEEVGNMVDFSFSITPDDAPAIYDDDVFFNIIAIHKEDISWSQENRLVERLTTNTFKFLDEHDCKDMAFYILISTDLEEDDV